MKRFALVCVLLFAGVSQAQPTVTFSGDVMEGQVVWYNNSWQAQSFVGDAGAVSLANMTAANGHRAFILPSWISWANVAWQDQGEIRNPFDTNINDIIGPFTPIQASPAPVATSGGGSLLLVVRNKNWQQAPSSGHLAFSVAVFSSAKKRTDPISFATGAMNADQPSAYVSIPNVKYFTSPSTTNYRVILGAQPGQQIPGATVGLGGQAMWTKDVYGYNLATNGHPSGANWSIIDLSWTFTAQ